MPRQWTVRQDELQPIDVDPAELQPVPEPKTVGGHAKDVARGVWDIANPMNIVRAVGQVVTPERILGTDIEIGSRLGFEKSGPINTLNQMLGSSWEQLKAAKDAFDRGEDPSGHLMSAVPVAGPMSQQIATEFEGDSPGRGVGQLVGTALMAAPQAAVSARNLRAMD